MKNKREGIKEERNERDKDEGGEEVRRWKRRVRRRTDGRSRKLFGRKGKRQPTSSEEE